MATWAGLVAVALAVAGCGGDDDVGGTTAAIVAPLALPGPYPVACSNAAITDVASGQLMWSGRASASPSSDLSQQLTTMSAQLLDAAFQSGLFPRWPRTQTSHRTTTAPLIITQQGMLRLQGPRQLVALVGVQHEFDVPSGPYILTWSLTFLDAQVRGVPAARTQLETMTSVAGGGDDGLVIPFDSSLPR